MTDQTVILKIIPILSADGLGGNLDRGSSGGKGGRTTETSNPTSKSNKGAGGSSVFGKFMAGVNFAPAAAGIAAAVTIIMQIMKDLSWAFKPVMSAISAISKMLGIIFVPVMQAMMFLLVPILQILRPIMAMIRVMMKPFEDVIRRAQRTMGQAAVAEDFTSMALAAGIGLNAMLSGLTSFLTEAILRSMVATANVVFQSLGGFFVDLGAVLPDWLGGIFTTIGNTIKATGNLVTDDANSLITEALAEINGYTLTGMNNALTKIEGTLNKDTLALDTTKIEQIGTDTVSSVMSLIGKVGSTFIDEKTGLPSLASGISTGFKDGIISPVEGFIKKLTEAANTINSIKVEVNSGTKNRAPSNWAEETAATAYVGYQRILGNNNVEVIGNTNTSGGTGSGAGARWHLKI